MDLHRLGEERSLALHALVVDEIERDERVIDRASELLARWLASGVIHGRYESRWEALLGGPRAELKRVLLDRSEEACTLRSCTPFAGSIDPRTRWRVWREVRERFEHDGGAHGGQTARQSVFSSAPWPDLTTPTPGR